MRNTLRHLAIAGVLMAALTATATAAPLGLKTGWPDMTASFVDFKYVTSGDACGAGSEYNLCFNGAPALISSVGLSPDVTDVVPVLIAAAVTPTGTLGQAGGILMIGSYLIGEITDFGYQFGSGNADLELLAHLTGGTLAPSFASIVGIKGTIYGFGGLGSNYVTTDVNADIFVVPEPASIGLLLVGLAALRARCRGSKRQDS